MAPPRPTITPHVGVPKVSFRKIQPTSKEFDGVDDKLSHQFGYNQVQVTFERPEHYIRYVDPVESELLAQVEYDMDEQDDEWLATVNKERTKEQIDRISTEAFEIIIDRLEKEWFELMKRVPKYDQALPSEDTTCAVCDDGEGENANAIVFCDGCNLAVHQDCYGVPYIPEGQWLCRKCTVAPESRVECLLCPNDGGAFKQTSNGKWAHLLCAIWVPECVLGNPTFMEPIENTDKIPKQRWKLVCSICKVKEGACIQCNKNTCVTAFHVSCARRHKLLSPMKSHGENELQAFCEKHLPAEMRVNRVVPPSPSLPPTTPTSPVRSPKKATRTQAQPTGPPLVPLAIVEKIMQYTSRITFRKKLPFLFAVCRYWSLKREARRGAPLLKRLHLEPWATSTATKPQSDEDKLRHLDNLNRLRSDLERVLDLANLVRQREEEKQTQAQAAESFITTFLLPFDAEVRKAYDTIVALDPKKHFTKPISRTEFPEYYSAITKPMHWLGIYAKIEQHEYLDSQSFVDDINLVLDNAVMYNKKDTTFWKAATRIKGSSQPILDRFQQSVRETTALWTKPESDDNGDETVPEAAEDPSRTDIAVKADTRELGADEEQSKPVQLDLVGDQPDLVIPETPTEQFNGEFNHDDEVVPATPTPEPEATGQPPPMEGPILSSASPVTETPSVPAQTGDLEPSVRLLHMLQDQASMTDDLPYLLHADPLDSFFTYERPTLKPPPPPPPPPPKRKHRKKQPTAETTEPKPSERTAPETPRPTNPPRLVLRVRDPAQSVEPTAPTEGDAEASTTTPSSAKTGKRKRQDSVPEGNWGQVVADVDPRASFTMFETGWVLPAGSTRIRRPTLPLATTKPNPPNSRKQSKEPKRVRMTSSITGDAHTPAAISSRQSSQAPPKELDVFAEAEMAPTQELTPGDRASTPPLASPASMILPSQVPEPAEPTQVDGVTIHPASKTSRQKGDTSSDLSELSDADQRRMKPPTNSMVQAPETPQVPEEPLNYEAGTLVWARQPGYPMYPAVVYELPDESVPLNVIQYEPEARRKLRVKEKLFLVQFYDKTRSWAWLPIDRLAMLGESTEIDQKYLHPTGKQSGKHAASIKELPQAYAFAMQEMETPEEVQAITTQPL